MSVNSPLDNPSFSSADNSFLQNISEELQLSGLPPEIVQIALARLLPGDLTSVAKAGFLRDHAIEVAKRGQQSLLAGMLNTIALSLDSSKYADVIAEFKQFSSSKTVLNSIDLLSIKKNLLAMRVLLTAALKKVSNEDLLLLKVALSATNEKMPVHFSHFIDTIILEKKIDLANAETDVNIKSDALKKIVKELLNLPNFDKALQIAHTISEENTKNTSLIEIAEALAEAGKCNEAFKMALSLPSNSKIFFLIVKKNVELGNFDKATESFDCISDYNLREDANAEIAKGLATSGDFEKSIKLIKEIRYPKNLHESIEVTSKELIKSDQIDKAIPLLNMIDPYDRFGIVEGLVADLVKTKGIDTAIKFAASTGAYVTILELAKEFMKNMPFEKAMEFINIYTDEIVKSVLFEGLATHLIQNEEWELAIKTVERLRIPEFKTSYLCDIAKGVAKAGNLDRAIEIVYTIPNEKVKANFLNRIRDKNFWGR